MKMSESEQHRTLVKMISDYITDNYGIDHRLIKIDGQDKGLTLNKHKPDLLYEFEDCVIIGEAKIGSDIGNDHTESQFKEYLKWCKIKEKEGCTSLIIYGVPSDYAQFVKNYLNNIRKQTNSEDIQFIVKTPMGQFSSELKPADSNAPTLIFRNEKPLLAKIEAFEYQKEAVNKIKNLEYAAIFHEQGLGKTKIAIDLMLYWFNKNVVDSVVIVTKKSLITNWKKELSNHTELSVAEVGNSMKNNYYAFNTARRVILTSFESFIKEEKRFNQLPLCRITGIIIDESAKIKNPETKITQVLIKASLLYKKRIIMTGTPIANRPYDIWSQIYFLDHGKSLGTDFKTFKSSTDLSNNLTGDIEKQKTFSDTIGTIFSKIENFTVRETKNSGIIKLPPKEYYNIDLSFELNQKTIYEEVRHKASFELVKNNIVQEDDLNEIIKRLTRLIEVTSNPALIDESYKQRPSKIAALEPLLEEINNRGEKTIIWTSFKKNINFITKELRQYNPVSYSGDMSMDERETSINRFITDPDVKVLVSTYAAKEGLTLTVANNAIFYDRTLNLDDYLQAQDRIHRISQTDVCHIYNLRIMNSIDEWIDQLLNCKHLSAKLSQGDITKEEFNSMMDYSFGKIIHSILGDSDVRNRNNHWKKDVPHSS